MRARVYACLHAYVCQFVSVCVGVLYKLIYRI